MTKKATSIAESYKNIEGPGLWRPTQNSPPIKVIISFGKTTLILSDEKKCPLTHWALIAIRHIDTCGQSFIFSFDENAMETLEISNRTMQKAIKYNQIQIKRHTSHGAKNIIRLMGFCGLLGLIIVGFFILPDAINRYVANIIPETVVNQISTDIIKQIENDNMPACLSFDAQRVLRILQRRLIPQRKNQLFIIALGDRKTTHLPNGDILINKSLLYNQTGPNLMAGYILLEYATLQNNATLYDLFHFIGIQATLRFFFTGIINQNKLKNYINVHLTKSPIKLSLEKLRILFANAAFSSSDLVKDNQNYAKLAHNDPYKKYYRPLLSDSDWLYLQETCY